MTKMHMATALIALAGDITNVVNRSISNPVSWPEIAVLQEVHGEQCIMSFAVCDEVETTAAAEKSRLLQKYGAIVEDVYPGRNPQMEFVDPTFKTAKVSEPKKTKAKTETVSEDTTDTEGAGIDPFAGQSGGTGV